MTPESLNTTDIRNICLAIADVYRNKMKQAGYSPNGELMKFTWVTEVHGALFLLYFELPEYWYYAENGRRPGKFPPPDAILKWIQYKQLVPSSRNGKVPSINQLVYLISRKIAEKGTEGRHLLQLTIDETYNTLVDLLVDILINELEKDIEKDIEQI